MLAFPELRLGRQMRDKGEPVNVILHIGAHRCATTSFQRYMRCNSARLSRSGIGFWGPYRVRNDLFQGVVPTRTGFIAHRRRRQAVARVRVRLDRCARRGIKHLVVSDENMLGTMPRNLREASLYPNAAERLAAYAGVFGARVTEVVLNIRSLDQYWTSVMAYGAAKGRNMPGPAGMEKISRAGRSWRHVVGEVAQALPAARLKILPFESFAGHPDAQLAALTGQPAPQTDRDHWLNAAPSPGESGATSPAQAGVEHRPLFSADQTARLREAYADDLVWLAGGADGLADLIENPSENPAGLNPPSTRIDKRKMQ
ncbi:hypothetical protein AVO45_10660 [Ruegeria marisrubri]|uniref:Sulfotransferase domain-containing protein n=1 Tax=Ruegeria marisrubri TaxID=1685379 RepID=A0A0X3TUL8_9RHOB|nr:hypothetical protein [Ruegeria marisrubri]KUJ76940.1 hypothetical protein AVO45_10660 [Ruegeria marisrubri]